METENIGRYVRSTDPETSLDAAVSLRPQRMWERILEFLYANDKASGWAAFEIAKKVDHLGVSPWHRVTDVVQYGWAEVVDGVRRPNVDTGRTQQTVRITEEGRKVVERLHDQKNPTPEQRRELLHQLTLEAIENDSYGDPG